MKTLIQKDIYSIIYNSQGIETTYMSTAYEWIKEKLYLSNVSYIYIWNIYIYNGYIYKMSFIYIMEYYLAIKKEGNPAIF